MSTPHKNPVFVELEKVLPQAIPHDSSHLHVTGKSEYIDDRPRLPNELDVEVLFSPHAFADIVSIDTRPALKIPGVVGVYIARDFHHNLWGTIFQDQPLLAEKEVRYVGEPVAIIAATSKEIARLARSKIAIQYKIKKPILSISEAKSQESWIGFERHIERLQSGVSSIDEALQQAPHRIRQVAVLRGAEHFYLESQASIAYPKEDGQIEVHTSSQHPTETQHVVAHGLGIPDHNVTCIVKRMGGGFGGKESQGAPFAAYAALVAHKTGRPARIVLTKDDDMIMTGKRNPFENEIEVGFDDQGRLLTLKAQLFSDGGAYADLSTSIMERAMLHIDGAYFFPNLKVTGRVCRTHFHPHTAFRGFGGPQGVATVERILDAVAHRLGKDPLEIRKLNCYRPGFDTTHYEQVVENNMLPNLFDQIEKKSDYQNRRKQIQAHNQATLQNLAHALSPPPRSPQIRGIAVTPVKFGISFTTRFLNQANALVVLHRDGSLQVSTGATEMGQGVNTRIAQLVSEVLGLPPSAVRVMPTATDKNANTSPTAASSGTDLNGAAAVMAAQKIRGRLSQVAAQLLKLPKDRWAIKTAGLGTEAELAVDESLTQEHSPKTEEIVFQDQTVFHAQNPKHRLSFAEVVNEAYLNRVSLSDYAFYKIPGLSFNKLTGKGRAFLYYTQGVGCHEVSVDLDTGEVKVLRSDILMDLGRPINPAIDLGQVTGGFVQGMGWVTTEHLYYDSNGALKSHAPSTYKIPSVQDTPRDFRVELIPNDQNLAGLRGMKAVGEPPLLLAAGVWNAIHDALTALPQYHECYPDLELPATQEQVLRAVHPEWF